MAKKRVLVDIHGQKVEITAEVVPGWCAYAGRLTLGWTIARLPEGTPVLTGVDREVAISIAIDMSKLEQRTGAPARLADLQEVARRYLGTFLL